MLMESEVAGLGRRVIALVADTVLVAFVIARVLQYMVLSPAGVGILNCLLMVAYSTVFLNWRGQTPGKMLMRLRVISAGGGAITQRQAFVRAAVKWTPIFAILVLQAVLAPAPVDFQPGTPESGGEVTQPPDIDPEAAIGGAVFTIAGLGLMFFLMVITRRHPDRQALHDRAADTFVIRVS